MIVTLENKCFLVIDSISSVLRMFAALVISFVAALIVGITAARKRLTSKKIIPIIDILQSVPILGFLRQQLLSLSHFLMAVQ
ncbi:MAG: hypothetical protein WBE68_03080 [Candidatus Nitrosopolaris sp.]